jgi:hypothetical protein
VALYLLPWHRVSDHDFRAFKLSTQTEAMVFLTDDQRRCNVCGYTAYGWLWLDDELPNGECPNGASTSTDCPTAMEKARVAATLIKAGVIR